MVRLDFKNGAVRECSDAAAWRLKGHALELLKSDGSFAKDGPFASDEIVSVDGESMASIQAARQAERLRRESAAPQTHERSVFAW